MPINPSALSGADDSGDPADGRDPDIAADAAAAQEEQPKRTRRTKAQMIADAVVPADDAQVELKDAGTGAKIQRPWLVAVEMVREGKAEWADKSMKYALMKYDQQKAAPAFEPPEGETEAEKAERLDGPYGLDPAKQDTKSENIPPEAEVGDEVLANDSVFRVGHGGVLTNQHSPISIEGEIVHAKRRWQRGADNEWRSADLSTSDDAQPDIPAEQAATPAPEVAQTNGRGDGEVHVESERLPRTQEHLEDGSIKIGTGILEKIGMPDYSSFQVGPITISRTVFDDGRRTVETFDDGREREVITAAVEGFDLLDNTVEFVAKRFRGQLISFLEATGSLKQPVS
jgi:hypothetical protein